jgi:hypothetical protein
MLARLAADVWIEERVQILSYSKVGLPSLHKLINDPLHSCSTSCLSSKTDKHSENGCEPRDLYLIRILMQINGKDPREGGPPHTYKATIQFRRHERPVEAPWVDLPTQTTRRERSGALGRSFC